MRASRTKSKKITEIIYLTILQYSRWVFCMNLKQCFKLLLNNDNIFINRKYLKKVAYPPRSISETSDTALC